MREETSRLLNLVHLVIEICVAAGFLLGLIPFVYLLTYHWVVPLVLISLLFSVFLNNGTLRFTVINAILAFAAFIPLIGFIPRLVGAVVSLISIMAIRRKL
jgi:hypothetical protein